MFIAALFTIAKIWKQLDPLQLMNRLRKSEMYTSDTHTQTHIYTYAMEYYSSIKKNEIKSL
jgi:hypothetical protein